MEPNALTPNCPRGRPSSNLRDHFTKGTRTRQQNGGDPSRNTVSCEKCNYCDFVCCNNLETMHNHLVGCKNKPENLYLTTDYQSTPKKRKHSTSSRSGGNAFSKESDGVDSRDEFDPEIANTLIATAIHYDAIAASFIDNPYLQEFVKYISRVPYSLPTRVDVGEKYRIKIKKSVKDQVEQRMKSFNQPGYDVSGFGNPQLPKSSVVLVPDGSSDGLREPVSHTVAVCEDGTALLVQVKSKGTDPQDAEHILEDLEEVKREIEGLGLRVKGVISDNESKMKNVRTAFASKYAGTFCAGDPPHALQLVLGDIFEDDWVKGIVATSNFLADKFRNGKIKQYLKRSLIMDNQRIGANLAGLTRWGSNQRQFKKQIAREGAMKAVVVNPEADQRGYVNPDLKRKVCLVFFFFFSQCFFSGSR